MGAFIPSLYQEAIFDWVETGSGNGIINAVAGSGKTTTLVKASQIISSKKIFFAAFNRHVVKTLKSKMPYVACSTIHAIGYQCLRERFGIDKLEPKKNKYRVYCREAARRIHDRLVREFDNALSNWDKTRRDEDFPNDPPSEGEIKEQFEKMVNLARCTLTDVEDLYAVSVLVDHFTIECPIPLEKALPVLKYLLDRGDKDAVEGQIVDYHDMIWLPYTWKLQPATYDWILVDEAQDLNSAQLDLVCKMAGENTRMLFVGDPQQAIYGFSGADSHSYENIKQATNATEFPLSICYRCPVKIVELAKTIVPSIEVSPTAGQGSIIEITEDLILKHIKEKDWVLCRSTEPLVSLCFRLMANRIPAIIKGKEIGAALVSIVKEVEQSENFNFAGFEGFLTAYRDERITRLDQTQDNESQILDFSDQVASISICYSSFNCDNVDEFKRELQKLFRDEESSVTLSTIHRVKGMETARVFILRYNKLPLKWAKQKDWQFVQENNLKYVAITRSQNILYLVSQNDSED